MARKHHRLSYCLAATYGRTFCNSAEEFYNSHPETIDMCLDDTTNFTLACTVVCVAGIVSVVFGIVAGRKEGTSWPVFYFIVYSLAYSGVSLAVQVNIYVTFMSQGYVGLGITAATFTMVYDLFVMYAHKPEIAHFYVMISFFANSIHIMKPYVCSWMGLFDR